MTGDAFRCKYCGGFINPKTYRCEYCGTQYMIPRVEGFGEPIKVITANAPIEVLGVAQDVDYWMYRDMKDHGAPIENIIRRDMAQKIADEIANRMEIYQDVIIDSNKVRFSARLRLVKPDFRF